MQDPHCLNITSAPRKAPLVSKIQLLLGGPLPAFTNAGWMVLSFGMIFVWVFTFNSEIVSVLRFSHGDIQTANALVTSDRHTCFKDSKNRVRQIRYRFSTLSGIPAGYAAFNRHPETVYQGVSYTARQKFTGIGPQKVQYRADDPTMSRLVGCRMAPVSWVGGLVCCSFAIIGLGLLLEQYVAAIRAVRLLSSGTAATGRLLKGLKNAPLAILRRSVLLARFKFRTQRGEDGYGYTDYRTVDDAAYEVEATVLYDPKCPQTAFVPSYGPLYLATDEAGNLVATRPWRVLRAAVAPVLFAVGNMIAFSIWRMAH